MAGNDWDVSVPIDHSKISARPSHTRDLKSSVMTIIQKEHVALGAANLGGQHLKGSARVYMSDSLPSTDPESASLDTAATSDDGRLAVVTAAATGAYNTLKVYMATAAGISTGWEGIRVAEAGSASRVRLANEVSVRGYRATGVSTTISLIKVNADNLPQIGSGAASVIMTSALPTVAKEVANVAYVDAEIAAATHFVRATANNSFTVGNDPAQTFEDLDLSGVNGGALGSTKAVLIFFKITSGSDDVKVRPNGDGESYANNVLGGGNSFNLASGQVAYGTVMTDASGVIEVASADTTNFTFLVMGYIK